MNNWEQIIEQAKAEHHPWKVAIVRAAKAYLEANHSLRSNPCGWKSIHGPKTDPVWAEYYRLSEVYRQAEAELWAATDIEYSDDPIARSAWEWRYNKVMARKCTHYIKSSGSSDLAADTMKRLGEAEHTFMNACGLGDMYQSPSKYIEAAFPNLKS